VKVAYTGVAAALIGGKTTHTIVGLTKRNDCKWSNEKKMKMQAYWKSKHYLIIDEFSMISKSFLAMLSRNISIVKLGSDKAEEDNFGRMNVILCGDLHQFLPVAKNRGQFLYTSKDDPTDLKASQLGQSIYKQFNTVVILKEQMRVKDPVWKNMLSNLRKGHLQETDIKMLHDLVIYNNPSQKDDFDTEPWSNAPLITPRHAVRNLWNEYSLRKWCRSVGEQLFVCYAKDSFGQTPLTLGQRISVAVLLNISKNPQIKEIYYQ
jgi:PIF1-like helicase